MEAGAYERTRVSGLLGRSCSHPPGFGAYSPVEILLRNRYLASTCCVVQKDLARRYSREVSDATDELLNDEDTRGGGLGEYSELPAKSQDFLSTMQVLQDYRHRTAVEH